MAKLEASGTADGNITCCKHWGKCGSCLKILTEIPYDPAVSILGLYPKEVKTYTHTKVCNVQGSIIHNTQQAETI